MARLIASAEPPGVYGTIITRFFDGNAVCASAAGAVSSEIAVIAAEPAETANDGFFI
jgi:hypothetical protein